MGLFSQDQMEQINAVAAKSKEVLKPIQVSKSITSSQHEIDESTRAVIEYFGDSPAILITSVDELHDYVTKAIESGYCGIDTETTGLDRIHDTIVGCSLYYPGGVECYIPNRHMVPIFETPYKNQLTYEEVSKELHRFIITDTKMIFANADFDLAMIYKDYKVDLIPVCYYDVILAWRCLKEDEPKNGLKQLYSKYVMGGKTDPKKFSDFFSPKLFPYCKPDVAKLYAANDAKITYELFRWQLPYVTKSHPKCQKNHLEKIADLVWNIEFPMIRICALMHRVGVYFDNSTSTVLKLRYHTQLDKEVAILSDMVQEVISQADAVTVSKSPFKSGRDFNQGSPPQVKYLLTKLMGLDIESTDKTELKKLNLPITNQLLKVRSLGVLINSFVDKLPGMVGDDNRVHSTFKSVGADTGRMASADPNVQNIPSHALDIRHQFRATPAMEMISDCDDSDGEVKITLGIVINLASVSSSII
jgi:DNA polymerase-1